MAGDLSSYDDVTPLYIWVGFLAMASCSVLLILTCKHRELRRWPSSLVLYITIFDLLLTLKFLIGALVWRYGDTVVSHSEKHHQSSFRLVNDDCRLESIMAQTAGFASISWNFIWIFNFTLELRDPLRSTKQLAKYYHGVLWPLTAATVVIMVATKQFGIASDETCWIRKKSPERKYLFDYPLMFVMLSAALSVVYAAYRLTDGLETTRQLRSQLLRRHTTYMLVFLLCWMWPVLHRVETLEDKPWMLYMDSLGVTLQSLLLALCRIVLEDDVRDKFCLLMCCGSSRCRRRCNNWSSKSRESRNGAITDAGTPDSLTMTLLDNVVASEGRGDSDDDELDRSARSILSSRSTPQMGVATRVKNKKGLSLNGGGGSGSGVGADGIRGSTPRSRPRTPSTPWGLRHELRQEIGFQLLQGIMQAMCANPLAGIKPRPTLPVLPSGPDHDDSDLVTSVEELLYRPPTPNQPPTRSRTLTSVVLPSTTTTSTSSSTPSTTPSTTPASSSVSPPPGRRAPGSAPPGVTRRAVDSPEFLSLSGGAGRSPDSDLSRVMTMAPPTLPRPKPGSISRAVSVPVGIHRPAGSPVRERSATKCAPSRRELKRLLAAARENAFKCKVSGHAEVLSLEPAVFARIGASFGVDRLEVAQGYNPSYLRSGEIVAHFSDGKSSSFFCHSACNGYIVKTIDETEVTALLDFLPEYAEHVCAYPGTLLSLYLGLYCLQTARSGTVYAILMRNVFLPPHGPHLTEIYDLKGSTFHRKAKRQVSTSSASSSTASPVADSKPKPKPKLLMDRDFLEERGEGGLRLGPAAKEDFLAQLRLDVALLRGNGFMDFSLLVGIRELEHGTSGVAGAPKTRRHSDALDGLDLAATPELHCDAAGTPHTTGALLTRTGFLSMNHESVVVGDEVYLIGLIDLLQKYTLQKRLEHTVKSLQQRRWDSPNISATDVDRYADRFLRFMNRIIA